MPLEIGRKEIPADWPYEAECTCTFCCELKRRMDIELPWNDNSTMLLGDGWPMPWYKRWPLAVWDLLCRWADWWCK